MTNPTFVPTAERLTDENNADQGWAAIVDIVYPDGRPGDCSIARERFADEAAARRAADTMAAALAAKFARAFAVEA